MAIDLSTPPQKPSNSLFDWFLKTPERAIDRAYQAAVAIKKLEDEFFGGNPISLQAGYSASNNSYFRAQLTKNLRIMRSRLAEYKLSARLPFCLEPITVPQQLLGNPVNSTNGSPPAIVQKLAFIDFILSRYAPSKSSLEPSIQLPSPPISTPRQLLDLEQIQSTVNVGRIGDYSYFGKEAEVQKAHEQRERIIIPVEKSILPGSLLRTLRRIQNSYTDRNYRTYEQDVVTELRLSQKRVRAAIQFFSTLLLVFAIAQQGSKYLIFSPIVDNWNRDRQMEVSFAPRLDELEVELVEKYRNLKVKLELESLITSLKSGDTPIKPESEEEPFPDEGYTPTNLSSNSFKLVAESSNLGERFKAEAVNLVKEINYKELEGIKNAFADVLGLLAGYVAVIANRRQLSTIKEFVDETLYSLNDSAKALILIISTDIIVGFHSADGWDALLTGIASHYGQPENRFFTRTFIAIVPVFLDGIFKFWIFQYLRQRSPSTATIYEQMNR
jgi:CemA family